MPKATDAATAIGRRILDQFKALFGGEWGSLSAGDRQLLADVAADVGRVTLARLAGQDTRREELQLHAQLANLSDAGVERVRRDFWQAANIVLAGAIAFVMVL
jgi:propanediol dehydratase small subunit